jgi:hypothetical protein
VLEGHDVIEIAGTGAGKSLIFAVLAIAAELAGFEGIDERLPLQNEGVD